VEIWVNPSCSKCRAATSALDDVGADYTVRRYLDDPPTRQEITELLARLGLEPWDVTRTEEAIARELGLGSLPRTAAARGRWVEVLVAHPHLLQRPIITVDDGTALVARAPEALAEVLSRAVGTSRPADES
jgi:arsenate reductase (glutaredoxin)